MKQKLRNSVIIIIICCLFPALLSFALTPEEIYREVIIEVKPGTFIFPEGENISTLAEIQTSSAMHSVLENHDTELIIKAFPEFQLADTLGIVEETGDTVKLANMSEVYKIRLTSAEKVQPAIIELDTLSEVIYAEPNCMPEPVAVYPNDPHFQNGDQWGLWNYGQSGGTDDADIDAPEAWGIFKGSSNIKIGIIDGGVENWHEDLSGKVSGDTGWGWNGHGFHVAGIAAANTDNSVGIAGVDWNAMINSQRIDGGDIPDAYDAIMDAVNAGCHILNNSWRLVDGSGNPMYSTTIRRAFANAYKLNRVAVVAMGNEGDDVTQYPAGFGQGIIAVGATDKWDEKVYFSSTGNHIDVVAPGVWIWSCIPYGTYYGSWSGTSMATPFASGLAGLLKGFRIDLYNDDIEQIIRLSANDIAAPGWDDSTGYGRINAHKALKLIHSSIVPAYSLHHWEANGGTIVSQGSGYQTRTFFGVSGLADGTYLAKWYKVQKDVTFPGTYSYVPPYVWGRGVETNGFSFANPNYGMGWCRVVPESITSTSATLETYVYKVYNILGQYIGWFPTTASNVTYAYTVLGIEVESDTSGTETPQTRFMEEEDQYNLTYELLGCFPNPSRNSTTIKYQLKDDISELPYIKIYNAKGQLIKKCDLVSSSKTNEVCWDGKDNLGRNVPNGIYLYRLEVGNYTSDAKRMLILK